jgi:hypothetical protein
LQPLKKSSGYAVRLLLAWKIADQNGYDPPISSAATAVAGETVEELRK